MFLSSNFLNEISFPHVVWCNNQHLNQNFITKQPLFVVKNDKFELLIGCATKSIKSDKI